MRAPTDFQPLRNIARRTGFEVAELQGLIKAGRLRVGVHVRQDPRQGPLVSHAALMQLIDDEPSIGPPERPRRAVPSLDDAAQLYRHFNRAGTLLYVGIAGDVFDRLRGHRRNAPWFPEIARVEIEHFPTRRECLEAEARAIRTERPLHNVAGVDRDTDRDIEPEIS